MELSKFIFRENRAKPGGICVANHTSPIDVIILQNDNSYAMVCNLCHLLLYQDNYLGQCPTGIQPGQQP